MPSGRAICNPSVEFRSSQSSASSEWRFLHRTSCTSCKLDDSVEIELFLEEPCRTIATLRQIGKASPVQEPSRLNSSRWVGSTPEAPPVEIVVINRSLVEPSEIACLDDPVIDLLKRLPRCRVGSTGDRVFVRVPGERLREGPPTSRHELPKFIL